jgi:putative RNA 2'-phosphotransferase
MNLNKLSKRLALGLRHNPMLVFSQDLSSDGFIDIDIVLDKLNITKDELNDIVDNNDKNRFEIKDDKIRARQGHSIKVNLSFDVAIPPDILYHGTNTRSKDIIMNDGIKKMSRQYVHLSFDIETATKVGLRKCSKDNNLVILKIDALNMYNNDYIFYLSSNNVWLIDYVPTNYISIL